MDKVSVLLLANYFDEHRMLNYFLLNYYFGQSKIWKKFDNLESSHSPQVPPPRQSYSPGGVTIFALLAVPLCPL